MAPVKLAAGNWKMNGSLARARTLVGELAKRTRASDKGRARVAVCPPFPLLPLIADIARDGDIELGAQDCHFKEKGAHTGDVSAKLLAELGCGLVIVGHSERRADHGETDAVVKAKAEAVLGAFLSPIICVGETEKQRDAGETNRVVERQLLGSWPASGTSARCIIAYEPVWAIGTGKTPTGKDVVQVHALIRSVARGAGIDAATLMVLYGGSVKGSNAAELMSLDGVDGALVGGASLDAEDFWKIVQACG